jgi:endonuclease YncB( thermonuclease family)
MKKYDEVDKLLLFRRIGLDVPVPEHLQAEFDVRWAEIEKRREESRRNDKLFNDPFSVQRFNDGSYGQQQLENGYYVPYEDYELVVTYLQEQLSRAQSEANYNRYDGSTSWRD